MVMMAGVAAIGRVAGVIMVIVFYASQLLSWLNRKKHVIFWVTVTDS